MSSLFFIIIAALVFVLAYRFYSAFIVAKILVIDEHRVTPAFKYRDDFDYSPTNKWVLFGQHFAAIAGAGPLIGPVLAAQYGFLPGFFWILIGSVFAGAVHDMVILFVSVRYEGKSLSEIANRCMKKHMSFLTSIAIIFIMVISMAGLGIPVVNALYHSPWGIFSVGLTIPISLFIGIYLKYLRVNRIIEATIIGMVLIIAGVVAGPFVAKSSFAHFLNFDVKTLSWILPLYGFLAAALPVWLFLVPRGYLCTYMKLGVMAVLAIAIIILHPEIKMPGITQFVHGNGPIIPGRVWPFLFITIACGALSGFHAMIASGTTSKLISSEKDIRIIGYGAMICEGFVALMALIAATVLPTSDYFAINTIPQVFEKLHMVPIHVDMLSGMVQENLTGRPGGAVSLAAGMIYVVYKIKSLDFLIPYFYHFLILFEALFILTTIDAGTRIGRFLLEDIISKVGIMATKKEKSFKSIMFFSFLTSFSWGYLLYTGQVSTIWPLFGSANQMLAAIALGIATTIIIKNGKTKYVWVTVIPWLCVTVTSIDASIESILENYLPNEKYLLAIISFALILLMAGITINSVISWMRSVSRGMQKSGVDIP